MPCIGLSNPSKLGNQKSDSLYFDFHRLPEARHAASARQIISGNAAHILSGTQQLGFVFR
jgi:hypothetical protein